MTAAGPGESGGNPGGFPESAHGKEVSKECPICGETVYRLAAHIRGNHSL